MSKEVHQLILDIVDLVMIINTKTKTDVSFDYISHVEGISVSYYPRSYKVDTHLFSFPIAYLDWDNAIERLELIKEQLEKLFVRLGGM